jgi:hypothetical protein
LTGEAALRRFLTAHFHHSSPATLVIVFERTYIFLRAHSNCELTNFFVGVRLTMRKTIKLILMLLFSLMASSAWPDVGDVDTEGYSMVTRNQTSTIRVQDIQVTNVVEEGATCLENGRQARNANGTPLFCQSGVWRLAVPLPQYQIVSNYACGVDNLIIPCPAGWQVVSGGGNVWAPQCGAQPTGGTSDAAGFWMSAGLDVSQPTSDMTGWWIGGVHDKSLGDNLQGFAICVKH